ncbi:MAG: phosphoribosylanthranilate isomerase [Halieaceae bacterium]|jgi:phosphoribosylanthranilate isomerase
MAVRLGADALGLVFYPPSQRAVSIDEARIITSLQLPFVTTVALFVNSDPGFVTSVIDAVRPSMLQFHGDETESDCAHYGIPYMKAIRVGEDCDVADQVGKFSSASALLLDTLVKGVAGGTGQRFDWGLVPKNLSAPLVLAGGLDADNVGSAIEVLRPYAVDVSGGVESGPGRKDIHRVESFVNAVRLADLDRQIIY